MAEENAGLRGAQPAPVPSSVLSETTFGMGELSEILEDAGLQDRKEEEKDGQLPRRDGNSVDGLMPPVVMSCAVGNDAPAGAETPPAAVVAAESPQPLVELPEDFESKPGPASTQQTNSLAEEEKFAVNENRLSRSDASSEVLPSCLVEETTSKPLLTNQAGTENKPQEPPATPQASVPPTHQPPAMGESGWEKNPDRPPQKLPIRFKDCVGRNFLFPWKKAKTWKGAKALINSAFLHVDVLGPHVLAGHYDLIAHRVWAASDSGAVNPELASFQHMPQPAPPSPQPATTLASESSASPPPTSTLPALTLNTPGGPPPLVQALTNNSAIILPELWDDIVEPGMMISMHMWPMNPPIEPNQPHVAPPSMGRGGYAPQPPPGWPNSGHGAPPPPPQWMGGPRSRRGPVIVVDVPPPRAKTRKRQDGL